MVGWMRERGREGDLEEKIEVSAEYAIMVSVFV